MKPQVKLLFGVGLILLFSTTGLSQTRKYSNEFLNIGVSAEALGMGNAHVASVDDVTASYWNPSGLTRMESNMQLSLMHSEYFGGIANFDYGSAGFKINEKSNLAISMVRFGVDNIPNTLNLIDESGGVNYDRVEAFSAVDYGFLVTYAREMGSENQWRLGGNAKIIHRIVGDFATAWGFGLDAGAQYETGQFNIALMARDVTTTFNAWNFSFTEDEKETLNETGNIIPENSVELTLPKFIAGANHHWPISENFDLKSELDLAFLPGQRNTLISSNSLSMNPRAGLELGMWDLVYVRGGVNNFQEETVVTAKGPNEEEVTFQPNIGAGVQIKVAKLDYAFTDIGDQSTTLYSHVISLRFDFYKGMFSQEEASE